MAVKNDLKKLRKEQRLKQADLAIAVGMCEKASVTSSLKRIRPALKQLFVLQHILKSLCGRYLPSGGRTYHVGSVMIIRHETVVFIPGRKYRSKTTGIDRLESVARMHESQYRMPALLHVP